MALQIEWRNGTLANWISTNPTLAQGEVGVTTDTLQFYIGTGSTAFTGLSPAGATGPAQTNPYRSLGDGSDGNVTISSGVTTLTRDMFYNNLTINGTGQVFTNNYKIFVKGLLDITAAPVGAINCNGLAGNAASGSTPGGTQTVPVPGTLGTGGNGSSGGTGTIYGGATGTSGGSPLPTSYGNGGTQYSAGAGGSGLPAYTFTVTAGNTASVGAVYTAIGANNIVYTFIVTTALIGTATSLVTIGTGTPAASGTLNFVSGTGTGPITYSAVGAATSTAGGSAAGGSLTGLEIRRFETNFLRGLNLIGGGVGGGGGGSGGGDGTNSGGGGGGGGQGGGAVIVYANSIAKSSSTPVGVIQANGGAGGAGGTSTQAGVTGGGGGGTGGAGGWVFILYNTLFGPTITGALWAASGMGGAGGNGYGFIYGTIGGSGGAGGGSCNAGRISTYCIPTATYTEYIAAQLVGNGINPELVGSPAIGVTGGRGGIAQIFSQNL